MKIAVLILAMLVIALAIFWAVGLLTFTYPSVVPNEPLRHPQKVLTILGTNMVLETGEIIGLRPVYASERSGEEISLDISNQVGRGGFEVEVNKKFGGPLEIFVRWPRKLPDSMPPFCIPIIPQTIGRKYKKAVAFGAYLGTNSQPTDSAGASH